jgi:alpha-glucosidase
MKQIVGSKSRLHCGRLFAVAVVICFYCTLFPPRALADDVQVQSLKDGVSVNLNGQRVELRVATPHAFCLHVSPTTAPVAAQSILLSGKAQPATQFTVISDGSVCGVKTAFGELRVDTSNQKWCLRDHDGKTLADWASLKADAPGAAADRGSRFVLSAGPSSLAPRPLYYGSGNQPNRGALTQTRSASVTGNGSTSLPQYWSTAGYGALLITAADNKPASWQANAAGGVAWNVPGDSADLYVSPAHDLYEWLGDQAELTGFAPVPPLWSFGYLQSRWGWTDRAYINDTLKRFRDDKLPVDAFIIDFEWYTTTPDYQVPLQGDPSFVDFGWNPALFPDPAKQIADFAPQLHIIGIRKPRLGNSDNLAMARSKGWILPANPNDPNSAGIRTRDLDFSNPAVQAWWQENNRKFVEAGMAGFWDDEGEINFTEYSYWNLTENALFRQVDPKARFWSLNRAFAPGLQRFGAAAWTGDIRSDWATLAKTPGDLLSYGLSGMPYSACDIGGFLGNPSPELLSRWMEAGVFFPIQRSHSDRSVTPRFPWLFGSDAEDAIRAALNLRYRLIPYYYSLAFENHETAAPVMRPLVMEFPTDEKVAGMADQWLMGKGLLAAPLLNQGGARDVYLPGDAWFDFGTNHVTQGPQTVHVTSKLDEIPLYVRAGTLLPLGPVLQYTGQPTTAPLELQIYPGRDGSFLFVQDDGKTLAYQSGAVRRTAFSWDERTKTLSWKISGDYSGNNLFHGVSAVLFSPQGTITRPGSMDKDGSISF